MTGNNKRTSPTKSQPEPQPELLVTPSKALAAYAATIGAEVVVVALNAKDIQFRIRTTPEQRDAVNRFSATLRDLGKVMRNEQDRYRGDHGIAVGFSQIAELRASQELENLRHRMSRLGSAADQWKSPLEQTGRTVVRPDDE